MEGASRWDDTSETSVRCKLCPACPKPTATLCCPSSVRATAQPSNTRRKTGAHPAHTGVALAVAPKGNGQPGWRHACLSSPLIQRLPPLRSWARRGRWHGQARTQTCLSSRRCCLTPGCISSGCRPARWRRRRSCKRRGQGAIASSWRPPNERLIGRKTRRSTVSLTAGQNPHTWKHTVRALPDKGSMFLGRPCSGHHHDSLRLTQAWPPEVDGVADLHVRVDLGSLGMQAAYRGEQLDIPTRKPRQSHKHPNPQWSEEHKAAQTALRRVRLCIEHALGGRKRSHILVQTFRHRLEHFEDEVIGIGAGLWNLVLSY